MDTEQTETRQLLTELNNRIDSLEARITELEHKFGYLKKHPRCPICGSERVSCRDGHNWEIETH